MFEKVRVRYLARKVEKTNAGRVTIAEHLERLGADEDTIKRYGSVVGGKVRALYEAVHGEKPAQAGAAVIIRKGKTFTVKTYAYRWDELSLLNEAVRSYGPTAHLVGA